MKCKNQYGWQEVLTCKQRWMTGSYKSRNPRWLNFLWSYFRQVELSVKFKVKYLTSVESIRLHTFVSCIAKIKVFELSQTSMSYCAVDHVTWTMWPDHVLLGAGGHLGQLGMVSGPCAFCFGLNMKIHSWALLKHTVTHTLPIFPDSAVLTVFVQFWIVCNSFCCHLVRKTFLAPHWPPNLSQCHPSDWSRVLGLEWIDILTNNFRQP